jgi:hypothetical protein
VGASVAMDSAAAIITAVVIVILLFDCIGGGQLSTRFIIFGIIIGSHFSIDSSIILK